MLNKKFIFFLFCFLLFKSSAWAALAIDGSATATLVGTTVVPVLTTTSANNVIIVTLKNNSVACPAATGVSDAAGLTWVKRTSAAYATATVSSCIDEWYAVSPLALSSDSITITPSAVATGSRAQVYGISGANTASPFDTNGSIPAADPSWGGSHALTISTNNANDILIGIVACGAASSMTPPTSWTNIVTAASMITAYNIVSSTQSSLSLTWTQNGGSTGNTCGTIVDAINQVSTVSTMDLFFSGAP